MSVLKNLYIVEELTIMFKFFEFNLNSKNFNIFLNYSGSPTYFAGGVTLCKTECVPSIQMYRGRTVHLSSLEGGNVILAKFDKQQN